jgi:tRNA-dihydrouridine synthase B
MVGRGAYGRPWLLSRMMHWFRTGEDLPDPSLEEQFRVIDGHYREMLAHYGTDVGVKVARKHIGWYTKGLAGSAEFRHQVNQEPDPQKVLAAIAEFYAPWRDRAAA